MTTLARQVIGEVTGLVACCDFEQQVDFAASSEVGSFLDGLGDDLVVDDEIQRRPELFVGLRTAIDGDQRGRRRTPTAPPTARNSTWCWYHGARAVARGQGVLLRSLEDLLDELPERLGT